MAFTLWVVTLYLPLMVSRRRYSSEVESKSDWIAATGLRTVRDDAGDVGIPPDMLANQDLSLMARGLYALLLARQGAPIDPYDDAVESKVDLAAAIEELLAAGLAVRVAP